ncbi:hypothetical protein V1511DRAFT_495505 [Dipodascopsis uninucleata]
MSAIHRRSGNEAVQINPSAGDINIGLTDHGSDWYWAAFCIFAATAVGFVVSCAFVPRKDRIFHYLSIGAAFFTSLTYFTMASNLGNTGVETEFTHYLGGGIRQVFYSRYIGWFLTSPLILTNILLFSGVAWTTLLFTLGIQEIYVVAALIGSLVPSTYKWGYFTFGVAAWILVMYNLIFVARVNAKEQGSEVYRHYLVMLVGIAFIWTLYPIAWGLSEGGNVIAPDSEGVFYGVLDVISLPVLCSYFVYASRKVSVEGLGLAFEHGFRHSTVLPVTEKHIDQTPVPETRASGETAV